MAGPRRRSSVIRAPTLVLRALQADIQGMSRSLESVARDKKLMAYTAAAMYGCAALDEAITGVIPGDPPLAVIPVTIAVCVVTALLIVGPRLPRWALALL